MGRKLFLLLLFSFLVFVRANPPCTLELFKPEAGTYECKKSLHIRWAATGAGCEDLDIELLGMGTKVMDIAQSVPKVSTEYFWDIPVSVHENDGYQVQITNRGNRSNQATSPRFAINNPYVVTLQVTRPMKDEVWEWGSWHSIYWFSTGALHNVSIKLHEESMHTPITIASNAPNTGHFYWLIPNNLTESSTFKIRVTALPVSKWRVFSESDLFTIRSPRSFTMDTPAPGTVWLTDTVHEVNWTTNGDISRVHLDWMEGETILAGVAHDIENTNKFMWHIPPHFNDSRGHIRVQSTTYSDVYKYSPYFDIQARDAKIEIQCPIIPGRIWRINETMPIRWTSEHVEHVHIALLSSIGEKILHIGGLVRSTAHNEYPWRVPAGLTLGVDKTFSLKIYDEYNENVFTRSAPFRIESTNDTIQVIEPVTQDIWRIGSTHTVRWAARGRWVPRVNIDLRLNETLWTIAMEVPNQAPFEVQWQGPYWVNAGTAHVRVSSSLFPATLRAESHRFLVLEQPSYLAVTRPEGGEKWYSGSTQELKWTTVGFTPKVLLALWRAGSFVSMISFETNNTGSYIYTLPRTLPPANDYSVLVQSTRAGQESVLDRSDNFSIAVVPSCQASWNCHECTLHEDCGYCTATQQCLPGGKFGPSVHTLCPVREEWAFLRCPNCTEHTTCSECSGDPECGWCQRGPFSVCMHGDELGPLDGGDCHNPPATWYFKHCSLTPAPRPTPTHTPRPTPKPTHVQARGIGAGGVFSILFAILLIAAAVVIVLLVLHIRRGAQHTRFSSI
eukprot:gnl/Trimastix_PCT/2017.p1 GENE.gnl/Trimastix_PCT/2017~~gnl/Trimastix_PCT/2017.p1  ORF type:complete len:785 (+),score=165.97 gnl/Trimastix_PCT/2017:118-2472(+)